MCVSDFGFHVPGFKFSRFFTVFHQLRDSDFGTLLQRETDVVGECVGDRERGRERVDVGHTPITSPWQSRPPRRPREREREWERETASERAREGGTISTNFGFRGSAPCYRGRRSTPGCSHTRRRSGPAPPRIEAWISLRI